MHLTADPQDPDTVYVNNLDFWKSTDGGQTFAEIATPHGDNHDLWIDPRQPAPHDPGQRRRRQRLAQRRRYMVSTIYNQPTAQFYHLATDNRAIRTTSTARSRTTPAWPCPAAANHGGITWGDCFVAGTGESGYIAVRPDNPRYRLCRRDRQLARRRQLPATLRSRTRPDPPDHHLAEGRWAATAPRSMKYRFAWTYPIVISPHDPNTLYIGGNLVFKTTDEGQSWQPISPDLTRADPETLEPTGGPVNLDAVGAEIYATVFAFAESPHEPGVLWAGSDDGLVHITETAARDWTDITPPDCCPNGH